MSNMPYVGSGPYCYSNSLAMMLGNGLSPSVIEFATSSPFGMQMIDSSTFFFDPFGWDPILSFDEALKAAGWVSTLTTGQDHDDALMRLKSSLEKGPVFVGPLEMGLLRYQPEMRGAIGADHYVVVLGINGTEVELHDPHGHPYATIPVSDFMEAWKAEKIPYGKPYMMRTEFVQVEEVSEEDVIRRSLANAQSWLSMSSDKNMLASSLGNGKAAEALAEMVEKNLTESVRAPLIFFVVKVGARRLADAATCLARVGLSHASAIMARQASLVGSLQHPLVVRDTVKAAGILRNLAPTYEELAAALAEQK